MVSATSPLKEKSLNLRDLLDGYRGETTYGKLVLMGELRDYVRRTDWNVLVDEIRQVDNIDDLNVLIGVGMKGILWYETIKQKARCMPT